MKAITAPGKTVKPSGAENRVTKTNADRDLVFIQFGMEWRETSALQAKLTQHPKGNARKVITAQSCPYISFLFFAS